MYNLLMLQQVVHTVTIMDDYDTVVHAHMNLQICKRNTN